MDLINGIPLQDCLVDGKPSPVGRVAQNIIEVFKFIALTG